MSVPYTYSVHNDTDTENPVKEVKGIVSFMDAEILFEYKVYNVQGNSISNLNKFSIALDLIRTLTFKKGLFTNKLTIEAKSLAFFEPLPGSSKGKMELKIHKEDREEALRFSNRMNVFLSQLLEKNSDSTN